ncbi:ABC transporter substrate-binding protein [Streptomyces sp. NPDC057888]|uniref:ABC transporter substrate-binding protein n=1 Tax=Streptomyces sp. NPDC057888 TaxID=3346271 RepID=UPI00369AB9CB
MPPPLPPPWASPLSAPPPHALRTATSINVRPASTGRCFTDSSPLQGAHTPVVYTSYIAPQRIRSRVVLSALPGRRTPPVPPGHDELRAPFSYPTAELATTAGGHAADAEDLRSAQLLWATIDSPWVPTVDEEKCLASFTTLRYREPEPVLSTHLPPARRSPGPRSTHRDRLPVRRGSWDRIRRRVSRCCRGSSGEDPKPRRAGGDEAQPVDLIDPAVTAETRRSRSASKGLEYALRVDEHEGRHHRRPQGPRSHPARLRLQGTPDERARGEGQIADSILPEGIACRADAGKPQQDLGRAKALIREAGAGGKTVTIAYQPTVDEFNVAGTILQDSLKKIGLKAELQAVTFPQYSERVSKQSTMPDIALAWDFASYPEAGPQLNREYDSALTGSTNCTWYSDRQVDRCLKEGNTAPTASKACAAFHPGPEQDPRRSRPALHRLPGDHRPVGRAGQEHPVLADAAGLQRRVPAEAECPAPAPCPRPCRRTCPARCVAFTTICPFSIE